MRFSLTATISALVVALLLTSSTATADKEKADAMVEFKITSVGAGIGSNSGSGTLTWKGHQIPFTIKGTKIGALGISTIEGKGSVHNLSKLEDFNGRFFGKGAGITAGVGAGAASLKNDKGVLISATAKNKGLDINLALGDPRFTLDAEVVAKIMADMKKVAHVGPKVAKSLQALANVCGCPVYLNVAWETYQSDPASNRRRVAYALDEFVSAATGHCEDLTKRESFCKGVSQVDIAFDDKNVVTVGRNAEVLSVVMNERGKLTPAQIAEALIQ